MAEASLIAPGEEGGARGAAHRRVGMEVGECHAFLRHPINPRGLDPAVVRAEVAATEIVRQNDNDIGPGPGRRLRDSCEENRQPCFEIAKNVIHVEDVEFVWGLYRDETCGA